MINFIGISFYSPSVAVVITFFVCWAPFHCQRVIAMRTKTTDSKIYEVVTYISAILYYISTTTNPILYHTMSQRFRDAFKVQSSSIQYMIYVFETYETGFDLIITTYMYARQYTSATRALKYVRLIRFKFYSSTSRRKQLAPCVARIALPINVFVLETKKLAY